MFAKEQFKGHAFRKGNQTDFVKKKVDRLALGLEIECKRHGLHFKWRLHSDNNVQCLHCAKQWQMNQRKRNPIRFLLRDAKQHAKSKNRVISITEQDLHQIMQKQDNKCALTGDLFNEENSPSLDRIDSEKGYTKDNIQFLNITVNRMKTDLLQTDFLQICEKITNHAKGDKK